MVMHSERISGLFFTLSTHYFLEKQSIWLTIFVMSAVLKILKRNCLQTLDVMNTVICGVWHMVAMLANNLALNSLLFSPLGFWSVLN